MGLRRILTFTMLVVLALGATLGVRSLDFSSVIAQSNSPLLVSAAASLTDVMQELAPLYQAQSKATIRYNFASSGALQQQIENGAPVDIFISAGQKQMKALQQKNLLLSGTQRNLLTNRLVLVVPANTAGMTSLKNLTEARVKRIAIGDPRSVPAGQYAEEALTEAGLWQTLKPKYVMASNVRQVLQFVEAGNADAGLVYLTDAKTTDEVKIAQMIPTNLHSPIAYPIAVLKRSSNQKVAKDFIQFLSSSIAKKVFAKYGFTAT
ncbi:MAG: molybdate ABC transporter substrate-binding protein [Leptolyngbyaceae cyanobacterium RM1_406_9]|nr:molybdate ABC transporter substrate-binding protein [Leptolyngbyaceae cyanobacterium RM1_406_9]